MTAAFFHHAVHHGKRRYIVLYASLGVTAQIDFSRQIEVDFTRNGVDLVFSDFPVRHNIVGYHGCAVANHTGIIEGGVGVAARQCLFNAGKGAVAHVSQERAHGSQGRTNSVSR